MLLSSCKSTLFHVIEKDSRLQEGGVFCRNLGGLSVFKSHVTKRTWKLNLQLQYKDDHCFCGKINCMCLSSSMYVDSLQRSAFSKSISTAVKVCFWLRKYPKGLLQFGLCKPGKQLKCNYVKSPELEGYLWLVASDMRYQRGTWLAGLTSTRCVGEYFICSKLYSNFWEQIWILQCTVSEKKVVRGGCASNLYYLTYLKDELVMWRRNESIIM